MSAKRNDISQIRKYLKGELDSRAMHELEKKALNDPFLMDALEGYGQRHNNQETHLQNLHGRLQQRIASSEKRFRLWPAIAVAAAVLLVMTIGSLWLFYLHNPLTNSISADMAAGAKTTPKTGIPTLKNPPIDRDITVLKLPGTKTRVKRKIFKKHDVLTNQMQKDKFNKSLLADMQVVENKAKDSTPKANMLSEVVVVGYGTQKKAEVTGSVATISSEPLQNSLQGRVAGVNISGKVEKIPDSSRVKLITGQVLSKSDGKPLPGVSVSVIGKNRGVLTDEQGHFGIQASKQDELSIAYIGFKQERLKVKGKDSLNIGLNENPMSLAEVVVVPANHEENIKEAHPIIGWDSFNHYLKDKAHSPDGKTGIVQLLFRVNPDNSLSDFKIIKSLSSITDQHVIDLIKQGSSWIHNRDGKPEKIKVKVAFKD